MTHAFGWAGAGAISTGRWPCFPPPLTIGIALTAARLPTIYPQPHDIPLDLILTEDGVAATRTDAR
jgi:5-formyltetrahydrofolate cyclo-ligase